MTTTKTYDLLNRLTRVLKLDRRRQTAKWVQPAGICFVLLSMAAVATSLLPTSALFPRPDANPTRLSELLHLSPAELSKVPIAQLNLLCAQGLCPSNEPDLQECNATLERWAGRVRSETRRHQYRFDRNPAEFEHSPGFYRMLMLSVVLVEDFGVHYDPERRAGPDSSRADDGFFGNPRTVFLQGLLGPERAGTCSSLPVLYVTVGRQLGYPLKLVTTKGHLFVRWEDAAERFNLEVTGRGVNRFDDEYYRRWPFELSAAEERAEGYLKSLTKPEELAVFLSVRGMCLREKGRPGEAAQSFAAAARLAPGCESYRKMATHLQVAAGQSIAKPELTTASPGQTTGE